MPTTIFNFANSYTSAILKQNTFYQQQDLLENIALLQDKLDPGNKNK